MRILFAGTPKIAVPSLEMLARKFNVRAVLTAIDKKSGRRQELQYSPIKQAALDLELPVMQALKLNSAARAGISEFNFDLLVVFAYGKIFGPKFLDLFPRGGINIHPSLLPKHRGASPLSATILAGDQEYGISIQKLALELDSGDILKQCSYPLAENIGSDDLSKQVAQQAPKILEAVLNDFTRHNEQAQVQDPQKASYCQLIRKEDALLDWTKSAVRIHNEIRAYQTWPLSYTILNGKRLNIHQSKLSSSTNDKTKAAGTILEITKERGIIVQTGQGIIAIEKLQWQNRAILAAKDFINGSRLSPDMLIYDNA